MGLLRDPSKGNANYSFKLVFGTCKFNTPYMLVSFPKAGIMSEILPSD